MQTSSPLDLVGIGIGPFNLSIAALSEHQPLNTLFLERKKKFAWHPGLLMNEAHMQTSYLKDLVTGIDPTNPYSFLNYLVSKNKFYAFVAAQRSVISRMEYSDYLAWASDQMTNTQFDHTVEHIEYTGQSFKIDTNQGSFESKHIVLGTGTVPNIPSCAPELNDTCFHAINMKTRNPDLTGKRVAIIGGGQTGADIFQNTFDGQFGKPEKIYWVSRRPNIESLDESCFTDLYFMPDYVNEFYTLDLDTKKSEVSRQKLTSDGITEDCLLSIYRRLYADKFVKNNQEWWHILPNQSLIGSQQQGNSYQLSLQHGLTEKISQIEADVVILCTGFKRQPPACLTSLLPALNRNAHGDIQFCENYSVSWEGAGKNNIYMVNASPNIHGIVDPQLSLAAWRAAKIINHVSQKQVYALGETKNFIDWMMNEPN